MVWKTTPPLTHFADSPGIHQEILDPVLGKRVREEKYALQPDVFSYRTSLCLFYGSLDKNPVQDAGIFPVKLAQINEWKAQGRDRADT